MQYPGKFRKLPLNVYDSTPAIILPSNTQMLDIMGTKIVGDSGNARYRKVALEPSHPGKIFKYGSWWEITGDFLVPDQFIRTGDAGDAISMQRALDTAAARNVLPIQMASRLYDWSDMGVTLNTAAQIIGSGFTESGVVGGNDNITSFGEPAKGTWIKVNCLGRRALTASNGNVRGTVLHNFGFMQNHPTPVSGWAPTDYDYVIENYNAQGGMTIGNLMLLGINRFLNSSNSGRLKILDLRGQVFREGIRIDKAYDVTRIDFCHFWPFLSAHPDVVKYVQANARGFVFGRLDGFHGGKIFMIGLKRGISLQSFTGGSVLDGHIGTFYCDQAENALYSNAPNVSLHIDSFTHQGEDVTKNTGEPIYNADPNQPNARSVYLDTASGSGIYSFDRFKAERTVNAVLNKSDSTINITNNPQLRGNPVASTEYAFTKYFDCPGLNPVTLVRPPINFPGANLGIWNRDFLYINDERVFVFETTANASGNIVFAHGISSTESPWANVNNATCIVKAPGGNSVAAQFTGMDNVNMMFSTGNSALAGAKARITLELRRYPSAW